MASKLTIALTYAARGWHVFPLEANGKRPATPNGHKDATTDEEQIVAWWTAQPHANIGIALEPSGLVVLDVDVHGEANGYEALDELTLPDTLTADTPSGGMHFYFKRTDAAQAKRVVRWRDGLDVLGGGYVVAVGSTIGGDSYSWVDESAAVVDVPEPIATAHRDKRDSDKPTTPLEARTDFGPAPSALLDHVREKLRARGPSVKGQGGDQHLYSIAAMLIYDYALGYEEALGLLREWNSWWPENKWSDDRLATKLRNGYHYAQGEYGDGRRSWQFARVMEDVASETQPPAVVDASDTWRSCLERAVDALNKYRGTTTGSGSKYEQPAFKPVADLFAPGKTFPPTNWLVQGLVTAESVGATAGEPKTCKTWAELEIDLAVASGTRAFGEFMTGPARHVAMFLAEDHERSLRNRVRALCKPRNLDPHEVGKRMHFVCRKHLDICRDEDLVWIIASCFALPEVPALIEIDPLRDIHSGDENDSTDMSEVMHRLRTIRDIVGCSVRFVHHSAKDGADRKSRRAGQKMRGSGAIHGALDCGFFMGGLQTDGRTKWENDIEVEIKAAQGAGRFRLHLNLSDDSNGEATEARWRIEKADKRTKEANADTEDELLLLTAVTQYGKTLPWRELRKVVKIPEKRADRAKARLLADGRLEECTRYTIGTGAQWKGLRVAGVSDPDDGDSINDGSGDATV